MSRRFNTSTPLGQMMMGSGLKVNEVAYATGISHRTISDYLAARTPMLNHHLTRLAELFEVEPSALSYAVEDQQSRPVLPRV
jgi:transcriptional regulator with XRE-family HTH domain